MDINYLHLMQHTWQRDIVVIDREQQKEKHNNNKKVQCLEIRLHKRRFKSKRVETRVKESKKEHKSTEEQKT